MTDQPEAVDTARRWVSPLFLVAAGLYLAAAATLGIEMATETALERFTDVIAPTGFAVAFFALLPLRSLVGDWSSWSHRVLTGLVVLGATGMVLLAAANLAQLIGVIADRPAWIVALNVTRFFGLAGYLLAGIVRVRATDGDRAVGVFLVGIPVVDITAFAAVGASGIEWLIVGSLVAQALLLLVISYAGPTEDRATAAAESPADTV